MSLGTRGTDVTVKAPSRQAMQPVFTLSDALHEELLLKAVEVVVPQYSTFTCREKVRSASVTVALLQEIETLLLERIPACTGISRDAVEKGLALAVSEAGTESHATVKLYTRERFRDSVRVVLLKVNAHEAGATATWKFNSGNRLLLR
jgi:hypothetical protein